MTIDQTSPQDLIRRLAGPDATLRDDQGEAVTRLLAGERLVVVQRTGWGKSAVYWITAALRRQRGFGPTLVVSPLLALMRDQVSAAERLGLRAATINSANPEEWAGISDALARDEVDVLLISPERLNSLSFRPMLAPLASRLGLLVIDEAHCISDHGHDFRPDYRRIKDVLAGLDPTVPVLATTATANERVMHDVAAQLGDARTLRGTLARDTLDLSVLPGLSALERYAFCDEFLSTHEGHGIIYALTVADADRLASFLVHRGHAVRSYTGSTEPEDRVTAEQDLKAGRVRALVATSALGMGFDDPDAAFVLHVGSPASPVAYYQQVGRAGRGRHAVSVLLPHSSDEEIWEYFDSTAFPPEPVVRRVISALDQTPRSLPSLVAGTDVRRSRLEVLLKVLDVEGAAERVDGGYVATGRTWEYDHERIDAVRDARAREAAVMREYRDAGSCLMALLRTSLDDPAEPCGHCSVCTGQTPPTPEEHSTTAARDWLRTRPVVLEPRKMWPNGSPRRGRITGLEPGLALARGSDPGWGADVEAALLSGVLDDELVTGVLTALRAHRFTRAPRWIASLGSPLAAELAERLSLASGLPHHDVLSVTSPVTGSTSSARVASALASVELSPLPSSDPVLLVTDVASSLWSITVAGAMLREAGAAAVTPLALIHR